MDATMSIIVVETKEDIVVIEDNFHWIGLLGFFILFHVLFVFNDKNIKNREKLSVCNLNFRYS